MGNLVAPVPQWLEDLIQKYAGPQQGNAQFETIVAAGAKAESGWDPFKIQKGGGGRGLFQFDINGGKGTNVPLAQLYSADYQASQIVPDYAQQYTRFSNQGLTGGALAANVAGSAEKPYGYNPSTGLLAVGSTAWNNYVAAWNQLTGALGQAIPVPIPQPVPAPGGTTPAPSSPGGGGVTTPAPAPPTGGGSGATSLDFTGSLFHVLASGGLVLLAIALILGGIWLLTSSKDLNVTAVLPKPGGGGGAAETGEAAEAAAV